MIQLDPKKALVRASGKAVKVSPKEWALLMALMDGKVKTRIGLLKDAWGYDGEIDLDTRTVDQTIARLRGKLGKDGEGIQTVTGQGYRADNITLLNPPMGRVISYDKAAGHVLLKVPANMTIRKGQEVLL